MVKLKPLPKLLKEAQVVVNALVRGRDGCCLVCKDNGIETTKGLQAHHYILAQGESSLQRFNPKNLITLCYGHHIHGVHKNPTISTLRLIERVAVENGIVSQEEIEEIIKSKGEKKVWKRTELDDIINNN